MFTFRQFSVEDNRSAMKVSTDAVILGAYADAETANRILDVGSGCGVIALLLAQRSPLSHIDGIEIDYDSVQQARENVARSPFSEQIKIHHVALQDFLPTQPYQSIVSNPPFFEKSLASPNPARHRARCQETLTNVELISFAANYLTKEGVFSVILPRQAEKDFLQKASSYSLYLRRKLDVFSRPNKHIRCALEFSNVKNDILMEELTIENNVGTWTEKYSFFTKNFYLVS